MQKKSGVLYLFVGVALNLTAGFLPNQAQAAIFCETEKVKFSVSASSSPECLESDWVGDHMMKLCENRKGSLHTMKTDVVVGIYKKGYIWKTRKLYNEVKSNQTDVHYVSLDLPNLQFQIYKSVVDNHPGKQVVKDIVVCEGKIRR